MGPSGCGAVEAGVLLHGSSWLGSCSPLPDSLVTVCCLLVLLALGIPLPCMSVSKCLWIECFVNILLLLPATEINTTNTVAIPHLRPFNLSPEEMSVSGCPLFPRVVGVGGATVGPSWYLFLARTPSHLSQPELLGVGQVGGCVDVGLFNFLRRC